MSKSCILLPVVITVVTAITIVTATDVMPFIIVGTVNGVYLTFGVALLAALKCFQVLRVKTVNLGWQPQLFTL